MLFDAGKHTNAISSIVQLAGPQWLVPVQTLCAKVRKALPKTKQGQLLLRSDAYVMDLLKGNAGHFFGALHNNELVAVAALVTPGTLQEACAKNVLTIPYPDRILTKKVGDAPVGVVQSLCALPGDRGRKFPAELLAEISHKASAMEIGHLFAQVGQANVPSWMRFLRAGYEIEKAWKPREQHARFLLRYPSLNAETGDADNMFEYVVPKKHVSGKPLLSVINSHLKEGRTVRLIHAPTKPKHYHFVIG